tara:strand:- start:588 stop:779 length:192 start_codon:yes stop_codon:yes gene_type:complete
VQNLLQRDEIEFESYSGVHKGRIFICFETEKDVGYEFLAARVAIGNAETIVFGHFYSQIKCFF